jgi:ankyrin repeat protein
MLQNIIMQLFDNELTIITYSIMQFISGQYGRNYQNMYPNIAAKNGHLWIIQKLREKRFMHCTSQGADLAASGGYLDVICDLQQHNIHCSYKGANHAAMNGHLNIIKKLENNGVNSIRCTNLGAYWASRSGYNNIVEYLRKYGINYDETHY